ncbi:MAG: LamG-like jellyroll fold domain-containing protein [Kiritimatiellia bacterium]|jgi:hypothetical protein
MYIKGKIRNTTAWMMAAICALSIATGAGQAVENEENMQKKAGMQKIVTGPIKLDGANGQIWPAAGKMPLGEALTVAAWVVPADNLAERMRTVVSKWELQPTFDAFDAYDAGRTDGLDTTGFLGAVFDGRYLYFAPQHNTVRRHGVVLRYDTHATFKDPSAWQAYDAEQTDGLATRGFYGAVFDGAYVYFTPRTDGQSYHTRILRYDTRLPFKQAASWSAFDVGLNNSYQGCAFDGRYVYFAPGTNQDKQRARGWPAPMLRYDTQKPFADRASYEVYELFNHPGLEDTRVDLDGISFDGRYMYYAPLIGELVVRFDTRQPFTQPSSWAWFKPQGLKMCVGPVFDGRHVYFGGYNTHNVVRYDTATDFMAPAAWQCVNVKQVCNVEWAGYDGGFFDGRYLYLIPFYEQQPGSPDKPKKIHSQIVRYDIRAAFDSPAAWQWKDVGQTDGLLTVGYNAGASDGRYLYFAPWHDGLAYADGGKIVGHGRVLRYDTVGNNGTFVLKYMDYGHNGGLCGAIPGPTFTINTDRGVFSARANRVPAAGRVHLAGVYDGATVKLYINGELVNEQPASGRLCANTVPVMIGQLSGGGAEFAGIVENLVISADAATVSQIQALRDNSGF